VQDAVAHLIRRGLIESTRRAPTETSTYRALRPWRRDARAAVRSERHD
jgi:hypothetical protein